jgi:hypothetical protein
MGPFLRVGGKWTINQVNGFSVNLTVDQNPDGTFSAAAVSDTGVNSLSATGSVNGPNFKMDIVWDNGSGGVGARGHYDGKLTPQIVQGAALTGTTFDQAHPNLKVNWTSEFKSFVIE